MEPIYLILLVIGAIISTLIVIAPVYILKRTTELVEETRRHNKVVEQALYRIMTSVNRIDAVCDQPEA